MKLTAELLLEAIRTQYPVTQSHLQEGCPPLGRPLLYEPGTPVTAGHLYLTETAAPQLCRPSICTIYLSGSQPIATDNSYICLDASWQGVFNLLQSLYDRYDQWERQLEEVVLTHGTVEALLQASYPLLDNPIIVISNDFTVVAQAGEGVLMPGQGSQENGADAMELLTALRQDALYTQMQEVSQPFLYPAHILGWRSWNVNIKREGKTTHRITLAEHQRQLRGSDGWLLTCLAPYVGYLLEQARDTEDALTTNGLRPLFIRILSDRTADYMDMSNQLSQLDWLPEHHYLCLVLKTTYLDQRNINANLICSHIERKHPCSSCFQYKEDIVAFFDLDRSDKPQETLLAEMAYFIRENFLKAGYSRVMKGHSNLRRQYVQACLALDVGGRVNPYLWIHRFNSIAFSYMLEQATRRLPGNILCHEKLLALQEYDEQQHTEYMKTLRTYLDRNLNAMQTAKDLFIHRSTLLYRLDKIKSILESDLDDPEELLYLSFSYRLLDNEQKKRDRT